MATPGPPLVSVNGMSNTLNASTMRRMMTVPSGPRMSGNVMRVSTGQLDEVSIRAASRSSAGTFWSAASTTRNTNGVHCQTSTARMETSAHRPSESHGTGRRPTAASTLLMGPPCW